MYLFYYRFAAGKQIPTVRELNNEVNFSAIVFRQKEKANDASYEIT